MLNIGNITDDQTERLIIFVRQIAEFNMYGDNVGDIDPGVYGDDAIETCNNLIERARNILKECK